MTDVIKFPGQLKDLTAKMLTSLSRNVSSIMEFVKNLDEEHQIMWNHDIENPIENLPTEFINHYIKFENILTQCTVEDLYLMVESVQGQLLFTHGWQRGPPTRLPPR